MNFENNFFTRSALMVAALMFVGCTAGTANVTDENSVAPEKSAPVVTPAKIGESAPSKAEGAPAEEKSEAVSGASGEAMEAELKKLNEATQKLSQERALIEARLALESAENDKKLAALHLEKMRLDAERAEQMAQLSSEIADIEEERAEIERKLALEMSRSATVFREKQAKIEMLELQMRELQAATTEATILAKFPIAVAEKKEQLSKVAPNVKQVYLKEPFVDGTLYISDRRIALNGPITDKLAEVVCDQLYFYNNQNPEYPIFIVIDNSPGGSVAAGYQIQKAMRSCDAPVYVVVKGFAASMAAVITTTAERSFCYPNATILHHQISTGFKGNLTVLREGVAEGELWYKRFGGPVAEKMGISLEEFTKQMYAHNSNGDWQEPGTRAVELKWVDHVVERIEETGIIAIKDRPVAPAVKTFFLGESVDAHGKRFVELPVLENPFDFWAIYDKDNYYRTR